MLLDPTPYPLIGMENPRGRPEYCGHSAEENIKDIRKRAGGDENGKIVLPEIKLKELRRN